jgi:hypothetical protein
MSCRNQVRTFKLIETNRYGFAVATLDVCDERPVWKCAFAKCWKCRRMFVAVWPGSFHAVPCVFCENQNVRVR